MDVTLGANMPLTDRVSAFATVSQTGGLSSGEQFMYNVGVSARFELAIGALNGAG